ncbi:TraK family protein [Pseudomonas sp. Ga0074129]|uniref:TraK family protein n=1 Tax=Pseudomonas sp. Ga0074129 TaxID=1752219 RepID=UPI000AEE46BC|nr:TraK family protein [Pseudomonas sp. Ga0074129]
MSPRTIQNTFHPPPRKSLSERIAARIQQQTDASTAARNRSVFISLREDIQQAVTDGWSLLAIWQVLFDEQRVTFTYQAFRRYARQLVDNPASASSSEHPTGETLEAAADTYAFSAKPTKALLP